MVLWRGERSKSLSEDMVAAGRLGTLQVAKDLPSIASKAHKILEVEVAVRARVFHSRIIRGAVA